MTLDGRRCWENLGLGLLFWGGTIYTLHVEDISQVLIAQVDKVECKGEGKQGGMSLIITHTH